MFLSNENAAKSYCLHSQPSLSFFASVVRRRSIMPSREFWWSVIELLWPRLATSNASRARETAPNSRSSTMGFCSNYTVCSYKKMVSKVHPSLHQSGFKRDCFTHLNLVSMTQGRLPSWLNTRIIRARYEYRLNTYRGAIIIYISFFAYCVHFNPM